MSALNKHKRIIEQQGALFQLITTLQYEYGPAAEVIYRKKGREKCMKYSGYYGIGISESELEKYLKFPGGCIHSKLKKAMLLDLPAVKKSRKALAVAFGLNKRRIGQHFYFTLLTDKVK